MGKSYGGYTFSDEVLAATPELQEILAQPAVSPSKYRNARAEAKGMTFQSEREAGGIAKLILAEEQHQIFSLRLQVRFPLPGKTAYVADACYLDKQLRPHIVDFKGVRTQAYLIKKRLFRESYGAEIEEA